MDAESDFLFAISRPRDAGIRWLYGMGLLGLVTLAGCGAPTSESQRAAAVAPTDDRAIGVEQKRDSDPEADRVTWDVYYLQGAKTGYASTQYKRIVEQGRQLWKIEMYNKLSLRRFGQQSDQEVTILSTESSDGALVDFRTETRIGPTPIVVTGKVVGEQLQLESSTGDKTTQSTLPWTNDLGGFVAVERSLRDRPLLPGEVRALKSIMPLVNQVVVVNNRLKAADYESVEMLGGRYQLLRIETTVELPGGVSMASTIWTDRNGDALKTRMDAMGMETFRATKEIALGVGNGAEFDLGYNTIVRVAKPLERPRESKRVRYRVRLAHADPAAVFVAGPNQAIQSIDAHTADVTVSAVKLTDLIDETVTPESDPPTAADRDPNSFIESNDPRVVALAQEAVGGEQDPVKIAIGLEKFVHDRIQKKNFSQALATAAEVAKSLEGDCTEHAMLLAGLARAKGIPARVAMGLVYMPAAQGFGYHMWDELFIGGRWVPFDATLADGGIAADHLKLAHSNLGENLALACFLPVANVLGQIEISIVNQ